MFYTSNERQYSSLSIDVFILRILMEVLLFCIVHISINFILDGLKFWMHVPNIHMKRTVS